MHALRGQQLANVAHVVVAGLLVEQVRTGQVSLAALQGEQPAQAAHVRRGERQVGAAASQLISQHVQRHVVAADGDDGALDAGGRSSSTSTVAPAS